MLNYILYRIGQAIALSLPLKIGYKLAVIISNLHYMFARQERREVKGNLKVIFPEKSDREIRKIRIRMFQNFAKYLVDFFRFKKLDREYVKNNISIEQRQYFDQAFAKGKGIIILSAHIGNWELGGAAVSLAGYPLWVVVLPHKDKKVNAFFDYQRKSKGINVVPLGMAVRKCFGILKGNNILALVGDRDFSENGTVINFFGKPTIFPEGPAALSLKTGAVILPVFMVRNEDDSFTLKIEKPVEFAPSGNKEKDTVELIKYYKIIIEDYIRKYPDQWYMFKRFWVE